MKHNPLYHDVCVDRGVLDELPSHGVPEDLKQIESESDALDNSNINNE